jgi:hypothetical protein
MEYWDIALKPALQHSNTPIDGRLFRKQKIKYFWLGFCTGKRCINIAPP